jgi:hypothetical protein
MLTKRDFMYAKMLEGSTFGLEIESSAGKIPLEVLRESSFYPLRDGSISGTEFTSDVLSGPSGVASIKNISEWFKIGLKSSNQESFHIHIKNGRISKEFIVNLYKVLLKIETELFSLFPSFIQKTSLFKASRKDYNKKLPLISLNDNIDKSFDKIYGYYLTSEYSPRDFFSGFEDNVTVHPNDSNSNRKWNIYTRYHAVNLIPALFNKQGTIEFRLHPNTFDYKKIMYWLLIVNAITKYAHEVSDIKNSLTIKEIIKTVYSNNDFNHIVSYLLKYIKNRKVFYAKSALSYNVIINELLKTSSTRLSNETLKLKEKINYIESGSYEVANDSINAFK